MTSEKNSSLQTAYIQRGKPTAIGTLGVMRYNGETLCYTLEEPWRDNQKDISCIPAGRYKVVRHRWETPSHSKSGWRLLDVPGRGGILIHIGNTLTDTEGCILVGLHPSANGVKDSRLAMNKLRSTLPEEFWLEIRNNT